MEGPMSDLIQTKLNEGIAVLEAVASDTALQATLQRAAGQTVSALKSGHKLLVAGNGGSAADAQHLVAEFVVRLAADRPPMRAVALTTNTSILTAGSNDYGFECIFARQWKPWDKPAMCSWESQLRAIRRTCCGRWRRRKH